MNLPGNLFPTQTTQKTIQKNKTTSKKVLSKSLPPPKFRDHFMGIPFERNLCDVRNGANMELIVNNIKDTFMLLCTRESNLDTLCSQETFSVEGNLARLQVDLILAFFVYITAAGNTG